MAAVAVGGAGMSEHLIKHMVNRFLGWKLPRNFNPDAGISFKADFNEGTAFPMKHEPSGTNLFDATQADAMVRYMIEGGGAASAWQPIESAPKKDGKHLRMFGDGESWHACEFIGHWYGGMWRECYSKHAASPTHWMPCDPPVQS